MCASFVGECERMSRRVAIIGAGMAGIAAARKLRDQGHACVLFEKSRGLGGRAATRRLEGYTFDTGATSLAADGHAIAQAALKDIATDDLVLIEKPIYVHEFLRVRPGDPQRNATNRYCWRQGMTQLSKLLTHDLEVRLEQRVEKFEAKNGGFRVGNEDFDGLIITAPLPQALELCAASDVIRPGGNCFYRPCLSVLLGFDQPVDVPYFALIDPTGRSTLTWLSIESTKSPDRAPEGHTAIVAQLSPSYSQWHYDEPDALITQDTVVDIMRLYGESFAKPIVAEVKRWRYSQPERTSRFQSVNPARERLILTGDGVIGGRMEMAWDAGETAAAALVEALQ